MKREKKNKTVMQKSQEEANRFAEYVKAKLKAEGVSADRIKLHIDGIITGFGAGVK